MASETLRLDNFSEANLVELTSLDADVAAAASSITVANGDGFATDDFIVLGRLGAEKSELVRVSSVTGTTIALVGTASFAHTQYDPVTKLRGDRIRVYQATNVNGIQPLDASFALLSTVSIQVDQTSTEYTAATGGTGYWWKQTYYNSVNLSETNLADSESKRGGDFGAGHPHYVTNEEVRLEAGMQANNDMPDQFIDDRIVEAESVVDGSLINGNYVLPLQDTSKAYYTPGIIKSVTKQLAAALVLIREYGVGAQGTNKDGYARKADAMSTLKMISNHSIPLLDGTAQMLAATSLVDGWPDETTKDAGDTDDAAGGDRYFTHDQKL